MILRTRPRSWSQRELEPAADNGRRTMDYVKFGAAEPGKSAPVETVPQPNSRAAGIRRHPSVPPSGPARPVFNRVGSRKVDELARELVRVRWERKCRAGRVAELEATAASARAQLEALQRDDDEIAAELADLDADRLADIDELTGRWIGGAR